MGKICPRCNGFCQSNRDDPIYDRKCTCEVRLQNADSLPTDSLAGMQLDQEDTMLPTDSLAGMQLDQEDTMLPTDSPAAMQLDKEDTMLQNILTTHGTSSSSVVFNALDNALLLRQCEEMREEIEQELPAHFYYKKFFETFINAMKEIQEKYPGETAVQEFRRRYYS